VVLQVKKREAKTQEIAKQLSSYAGATAPDALQMPEAYSHKDSRPKWPIDRLLLKFLLLTGTFLQEMASFYAGLHTAIPLCCSFSKQLNRCSRQSDKHEIHLDLLGEAVITEAEAQSYLDRYLIDGAVGKLRRRGRRSRQWTKQKQIMYHEFRFLSS